MDVQRTEALTVGWRKLKGSVIASDVISRHPNRKEADADNDVTGSQVASHADKVCSFSEPIFLRTEFSPYFKLDRSERHVSGRPMTGPSPGDVDA
jgi:hypothetical protein